VAWTTAVPEETEHKLEVSSFVLRDGTLADIDALEGERLYDDCATYRGWLTEGQQLLVAEDAGRVVSYVWLDLARSIMLENLPEYRVEIGPLAAYGHEAWTLPSHRGRSLRRLTYVAEVLAARRAGKRWLVAYQLKEETLDVMLTNLARTGIPRGEVIDVVHVFQGGGFRFTWHRRPRRAHEAARFVRIG
jgi:GNAT superfamily N-acetyltransferase